MNPGRRLKYWGQKLALVCGSVLFTLILIEIGLRLFYPQFGNCQIGAEDEELGARLVSDYTGSCIGMGHETVTTVQLGPQGFRNPLVEMPKPSDTYRILMLGDSTTFGFGVDQYETVPALLESAFDQNKFHASTYEVINAGVPGYGTAQEWLLYKRWVHQLDPDLVILMFLVTNDIEDNMCFNKAEPTPCFTIEQNQLVRKETAAPEDSPVAPPPESPSILNDLHTYIFLRTRGRRVIASNPEVVRFLTERGFQFDSGTLTPTLHSWYDADYAAEGWQLTQALLDALLSDTRQDALPLMLVILPGRPQTTENYATLSDLLYGDTIEGILFRDQPRRPQEVLARWADERGVPYLDTLDSLKQVASSKSINLIDGHFNALGNQVIASGIYAFLTESGILQ